MNDVDQSRLDRNWRAICAELAVPAPSRIERVLHRIGVPRRYVRLVLATPALRRAWYLAIAIAVVVGLGATDPARPEQSVFTLLVVAPLVPVLGVALAYGPSADPLHEAQIATPFGGLRLVMVRAATVVIVSMVVIVAASMLSDVARPMAAAWLLPALALTIGSLAAMTVLPPRRATVVAAVTWVVITSVVRAIADDPLAAFGLLAQVVWFVAAVVLGTVLFVRRAAFDRLVTV